MAAAAIDLTGRRFGRLTVERRGPDRRTSDGPRPAWVCRCDCGGEALAAGRDLRSGRTRSCGCLRAEANRRRSAARRRAP